MVVRRPRKVLPDACRSTPVRTPGTKHGSDVGNGSTGNGLCGNGYVGVKGVKMDSKTYMIKLHHAGLVDVTEVTDIETANEVLEV